MAMLYTKRGWVQGTLPAFTADNMKAVDDALYLASAPLVTALPTAANGYAPFGTPPVDGQEIYFIASALNGVVWHLVYRAADTSGFPWQYLGGPPLIQYVDANESVVGDGTWRDPATVGPSISVPVAGDYDFFARCEAQSPSADVTFQIGVADSPGANPFVWASGTTALNTVQVSRWHPAMTSNRWLFASSVTQFLVRYWINGTASGLVRRRHLLVRPVRVG